VTGLFLRDAKIKPSILDTDQGIRLPHAVVIAFGTLGFLIAAAIWAPK